MRIELFRVRRVVERCVVVKVPALTLNIGRIWEGRCWGVEITLGVRPSRRAGERWSTHEWVWNIVGDETLHDHPWTWWSPLRPIYCRTDTLAVAWTGRDQEMWGWEWAPPWDAYRRRWIPLPPGV